MFASCGASSTRSEPPDHRCRSLWLARTQPSAQFRQILALLRRGQLEDLHRNRARLMGNYQEVAYDPVFRPRAEPHGKTLTQVIAAFRAEPERAGQITKLQQTYSSVFRLAGELFGADRPIREIDREECKAFRAIVQALPPNATKRFPGKSLLEVAKLAASEPDRLRPATVNHYLDSLATLFNYAECEGVDHSKSGQETGA